MNALVTAPLDGEVLGADDDVRVIIRPSILRQQRHEVYAPSGLSIAEILEINGNLVPRRGRLQVSINGEVVPREWWGAVRPKKGVILTVVGVPAKGGFKSILAVVVAVAVAVAVPFLAAPLIGALGFAAGSIGATIVTGLVGAAVSVAAGLAVNALFPAAQPKFDRLTSGSDSLQQSPSYSIGGARNEARPYAPIPVVLGTHRHSPPLGAQAYTEFFGDDQYLRMLFVWGYGPIQVSDLKIGETPIANFEGIEVETVQSFTGGGLNLYPLVTIEEQLQTLLEPGSAVIRTTADDVDEFTVDLVFPQGVFRFQRSDGRRVAYTVNTQIEYSVTGAGVWVDAGIVSVTASSPDVIRRSTRVVPPSAGQYDVRVTRLSANYVGDDTVGEDVAWTALRSQRNETPINSGPPLTVTAIRVKASEELSGVINTFNGLATTLVKSWNGSSWVDNQPSQNPADLFRHVLQCSANARPRTDAEIDLENLQEWHAYCASEGFKFNHIRDFTSSVYDTLKDIAAAGRAAVSMKDGKWGVVWDEGATAIVQHFTPRNSSNFSAARAYADLPHAWRVRFLNEDENYLQDERIVYDDGFNASNATRFEGIDFPGVTDPDLIWRHGRYHIAQIRLRRETYELDTDFEHLVATRGDRVRVQHDVPLWGAAAGRVKAVDGQDVTLDEPITMVAGTNYTLRFRLVDGSTLDRTVTGVTGTFTTVTLSGSGDVPDVGDMFMAGEIGQESVVLRVLAVVPRSDLGARLIMVDDAPGINDADTGPIPAFETGITGATNISGQTVAPVAAYESLQELGSAIQSRVRVTWSAPAFGEVVRYLVRYRLAGTTEWITRSVAGASTRLDIFDLSPGLYEIEVRALFSIGISTPWAATTINVNLAFAAPADVQDFRAEINGDTATLQWSEVQGALVSGYQIRFSPLLSGVLWSSAAPIVSVGRTPTVQVAARSGTYLIKAVTINNQVSVNATSIVSNVDGITNFNAVETLVEAPDWTGAKTNVAALDGELRLIADGDIFALSDWFGPGDFFYSASGITASGTYLFSDIIDLGEVYTSAVTAVLDAFGENITADVFAVSDWFQPSDFFGVDPALWGAAIDVAHTEDDPALENWSAWAQLSATNIQARAFKFRLRLDSFDPSIAPVVRGASVAVDMPDRIEAGNDLVVTTAGRTITFSPAFRALQGLGIVAQDLATGDYYEVSSKTESGFTIVFRNSSGSPVERTFDYVAKGYGRVSA